MKRFLAAVALVSVLAAVSAAAGQSKGGPLVFKVRLIQEATYRHPHPPAGDAGDVFSTTLRLFAIGTEFGYPDNTPIGTMAFSWSFTGTFQCGSSAPGCKGTTSLQTVTKLPGGTLTANASKVNLATGLVVPILSGTGIFKGATGSISIAPAGIAVDVFHIVLPA